MHVPVEWSDISLRLALTVFAGALIGINRTERGRSAGLRTTILVCLASSLAMIQANLLMASTGKAADSFVNIDVMRLPLGILTGMGFIGGGAILRRGEMVQGVTTAATLWLVTVLGLCFGAGQFLLGLAGLAIALIVLWGLRQFELALHQDRHATLKIRTTADIPSEDSIRATLLAAGFRIGSWDVAYKLRGDLHQRHLQCELRWHGQAEDTKTPPFLQQLKQQPGVIAIRWSE